MSSMFWLLAVAGGLFRYALGLAVKAYCQRDIVIPDILGITLIILAAMPEFARPVAYPFPLSLTLGFVGVDMLTKRRAGHD